MAGCMKMTNGFVSESSKFLIFIVTFIILPEATLQTTGNKYAVTDLHDGEELVKSGPDWFCYKNSMVPTWRQTWTRIQVKVWSSKVFRLETVEGEEELQELERFSLWSWFQSLLREQHNETTINISLFKKKICFKVDPSENTPYTVKPTRRFDIYLFLVFLSGVLLFVFADSLSRSQVFFYSAGMSTGMFASLIVLFFILARFLPKKSPFYILIVGGWSFSLYAIQLVCRNLSTILREHWHLVLGYVVVVGFICFAVCYRYGPLVDEKSINILSWTLQLIGLLLIYLGIQLYQVAFAIIVAALLAKNLEYPVSLAVAAWSFVRRKIKGRFYWKPQPRRLLTEEEYQREGEEETRLALEELRKYCNSPEFSPWKTVSRLQSPKRFADFVEGSPHLMPNEVSVHAQEYDFLEDDFFDTDDEEEPEFVSKQE
uniref:Nuclear envelope integral membrane protein 1 n=1 Tax=Oryzias sinensis TaxID=183150 RepID=A0A8C7ZUT0_9TELE